MSNPRGMPVWYELVTTDADASAAFYEAAIGWRVEPRPPGPMDYRMIAAGTGAAERDHVGGLAQVTGAATATMKPGWRFYLAVDDVDATAGRIAAAGGSIALAPFDLEGVGRMALVADPQGMSFYILHGAGDQDSTAFDRAGMGKCNWNELATCDQAAANAFYGEVFGWTFPDRMAMPGDMGDYVFAGVGDTTVGATMAAHPDGPPAGWRFYFRASDVEAAAATIAAKGGHVVMGPVDVPGGDRIIVARDPHGTLFGVVGPGAAA